MPAQLRRVPADAQAVAAAAGVGEDGGTVGRVWPGFATTLWRRTEVTSAHAACTARGVREIFATDAEGVLVRLVAGKMGEQARIASIALAAVDQQA